MCVCVCAAPPAPPVEEPEQWQQQQLSTLELYIQTHNKNPIERVSDWKNAILQATYQLLVRHCLSLLFLFSLWQRTDDSLMICAEPNDFTVGEFITVGLVVLY